MSGNHVAGEVPYYQPEELTIPYTLRHDLICRGCGESFLLCACVCGDGKGSYFDQWDLGFGDFTVFIHNQYGKPEIDYTGKINTPDGIISLTLKSFFDGNYPITITFENNKPYLG